MTSMNLVRSVRRSSNDLKQRINICLIGPEGSGPLGNAKLFQQYPILQTYTAANIHMVNNNQDGGRFDLNWKYDGSEISVHARGKYSNILVNKMKLRYFLNLQTLIYLGGLIQLAANDF